MLPQETVCAQQTPRYHNSPDIFDLEPAPIWPIEDAEQCVEAIEGLALDVGYFADLVQASRRLEEIKAWVAREIARLEAGCPRVVPA